VGEPEPAIAGRDTHLDDRLDEEASIALAGGDALFGRADHVGDELADLQTERVDLGGNVKSMAMVAQS
jgi:hypothetical protein